MIIVKYQTRDFFGRYEWREDSKNNETLDDVKKAFRLLKLNADVALQIDNVVLYWDSIKDAEAEVITMRTYDGRNNYTEQKCNYNGVKKNYYNHYRR